MILLLGAAALAATCDAYADGVLVTRTEGAPITESSGLAPAHTRPGVWFTHDDSGGAALLYAFSLESGYLETHVVDGATNDDWEDLAAGPCPAGLGPERCLFIGDIGDNARARSAILVYIVAEPAPGERAPVLATWVGQYPTGPQDSESLLVHPLTGRVYLVTKSADGKSDIYAFPEDLGAGGTATLEPIATFDLSTSEGVRLTTGADWDPEGQRLVIRTYDRLFVWQTDPCAPDAHWADTPTILPLRYGERQGEAVAFDLETADLISSSEGDPMEVSRYACLVADWPPVDCDGDTAADTAAPADTATPSDSTSPNDSGADEGSVRADGPAKGGCGSGAALLGLLALRSRRRSA